MKTMIASTLAAIAVFTTTTVSMPVIPAPVYHIVVQELDVLRSQKPITIKATKYKQRNQTYCLAQNIYFEARNQSIQGQIAVAHVTLNRVSAARYENTICSVVYEDSQFTWTNDGKSDTPDELNVWKDIYNTATVIMMQHTEGTVYAHGAMSYHADYVTPYWADDMILLAQIGTHLFYK